MRRSIYLCNNEPLPQAVQTGDLHQKQACRPTNTPFFTNQAGINAHAAPRRGAGARALPPVPLALQPPALPKQIPGQPG